MPTILFQSIWCFFVLRTLAMFILAFEMEICSWMDFSTQFSPSLRLLACSVFPFLRWMVLAMTVFALQSCWTMASCSATLLVYRSPNNYKGTTWSTCSFVHYSSFRYLLHCLHKHCIAIPTWYQYIWCWWQVLLRLCMWWCLMDILLVVMLIVVHHDRFEAKSVPQWRQLRFIS